jgi:hypothetical protein
MKNLLTRRLNGFASLTDDDRGLLDEIIRPAKWIGARTDLIREGDKPDDVHLILGGFACR